MDPKISVIIPCYNMGSYVSDAIKSVLSYPKQADVEIIIINDGSNDNGYTKDVLDSYKHEKLRVIHQDNKGLSNARNTGILIAKGDYIIPLDADNKIYHEYITQGICILNSNPNIAVVYGDNRQFGLKNRDVIVGDFDISKLLIKNYIDACVVLRKSAWESVNGYDENMRMGYEDWDLNLRLFFKGWQFKYVNQVLYDYRVRENSMLVNSNKNRALILDYIFSKPEFQQIRILRNKILAHLECEEELNSLKNRKLIRAALKIEEPLKVVAKMFKK
ncbi:MAG TPA: glycosyltransferase [Lutibacter sp.]